MRKLLTHELDRKSVEEFHQSEKNSLVVVLDNVRSLHNVGSVFRTADAFLLEGICLCGITGTPPNKEIQKTALGATDTVAWKHFNTTLEALAELKQNGYTLVAIEQVQHSVSLKDYAIKKGQKLAVVFGHEVNGVDQQVVDACDAVVEIPQLGTKHSLNIAVCAGIVVYDFISKLNL